MADYDASIGKRGVCNNKQQASHANTAPPDYNLTRERLRVLAQQLQTAVEHQRALLARRSAGCLYTDVVHDVARASGAFDQGIPEHGGFGWSRKNKYVMLKDDDGFGSVVEMRRCESGSSWGSEETVCEVQVDVVEVRDGRNECDLPPRKKTSWRERERGGVVVLSSKE